MNKCDKLLIPAFQPLTVYLSISTTPEGTKGMQNGHWQPCRISLSAKSGCFLSLLSLDVFMWGWEFATMKGAGASRVSDPHRRGALKVKKRAKARDGWTRRREKSARRGRGGTPAGSQASWLAVPILASDGFCQRGEKRVSSSLGHGRIDVLSVREGVSVGENGGMLKEEESQGPIFTRDGVVGVGSPLGLGRCWNGDDLLALVSLVALGHHPSFRSERVSRGRRHGGRGRRRAAMYQRHLNTFYGHGALLALRPSWYFCPILS